MKCDPRIVLLAASTIGLAPAPAKGPADSFSPTHRLEFSCLSAVGLPGTLYFRTLDAAAGEPDGKIVVRRTTAPFSIRSQPSPYHGPATLEFFDQPPPPGPPFDPQGQRLGPEPVAIATLSHAKVQLLFLEPIPAAEDRDGVKYRVRAFDDSPELSPWGSYRLINLTERSLTAYAGSRRSRIELEPGGSSRAIQPGGEKRNLLWVIYDFAVGADKPVYSSQWTHRPSSRITVFIADAGPSGLKLQSIVEHDN